MAQGAGVSDGKSALVPFQLAAGIIPDDVVRSLTAFYAVPFLITGIPTDFLVFHRLGRPAASMKEPPSPWRLLP